jgi:hypothetical protein
MLYSLLYPEQRQQVPLKGQYLHVTHPKRPYSLINERLPVFNAKASTMEIMVVSNVMATLNVE